MKLHIKAETASINIFMVEYEIRTTSSKYDLVKKTSQIIP
jgi:hypothetical protein